MYSLKYIDIINFCFVLFTISYIESNLSSNNETRTLTWLMCSTLPNPGLKKQSTYRCCRNRR